MIFWSVIYLGVGVFNNLDMMHEHYRPSIAEFIFNLLLWPVQVVFYLLVAIHGGIEWLMERFMR